MSLTKATYSIINGAPINLLDYGADPLGVLDSTLAIHTAINAALLQGKKLYVPAGNYMYTSDSTFLIDTLTAQKSLEIYGDGSENSVLKLNANNKIFTVNSGENGSGPSYQFIVKKLGFQVQDNTTNNDATIFYVCRTNNDWGAHFYAEDCYFDAYSNSAIWGVRCFNSGAKRCTFHGASIYHVDSGSNPTGFSDSGIRLWGADGSLTLQNHSFSNEVRFDQCVFRDSRVGADIWNMVGSFAECTFTENWIGLLVRPNPTNTIGGTVSSAEKGGYGTCNISVYNSWFEDIYQYAYSNVDIDLITAVKINPAITAIFFLNKQYTYIASSGQLSGVTSAWDITGDISGARIFSTVGTQVGVDNVWTDFFQPSVGGVYNIIARIYGSDASVYSAMATVFHNGGGSIGMLNKAVGTGALLDLRVNYPNIQYKALGAGATPTVEYSIVRLL